MFPQRITPVFVPHKRKAPTSHAVVDLALEEVYKVSLSVPCESCVRAEGATARLSHRWDMIRTKWRGDCNNAEPIC
jgi:hypothetical protein